MKFYDILIDGTGHGLPKATVTVGALSKADAVKAALDLYRSRNGVPSNFDLTALYREGTVLKAKVGAKMFASADLFQ